MKLKGKISITRPNSNVHGDYINITISDDTSGCEFVDLTMSMTDFAYCVTGMSHQDCSVEFRPDNVGKTMEHKTISIPRPKSYGKDVSEIKNLLAPHEVDGWVGNASDASNHHQWGPDDTVSVSFHRFV